MTMHHKVIFMFLMCLLLGRTVSINPSSFDHDSETSFGYSMGFFKTLVDARLVYLPSRYRTFL